MVNDTLGHEAGDNCIISSINLIKSFFIDVPIYRVGGDEFALILMDEKYKDKIYY